MRRTIGTALAALLVLGLVAAPAAAKRGGGGRTVNLLGTLTGVFSDALMVDVEKANRPGRRYLQDNPGDAMVMLSDRTRFRGPMRLVDDAEDLRVGDGVRVKARLRDGLLVARRVELRLHAFEGTLEAFDGASATLAVLEANRIGDAYLESMGNPASVTAAVTPGTKIEREGGGDPQVGDAAELVARPAADGSGLEAVKLETAPAA